MEVFLIILLTIIFPPILLFGFYVVKPREEVVVLAFGRYITTHKRPGINWMHPAGRELRRISTKETTLDVPAATVVEKNGNPIHISAVVVYHVVDCQKAALDVENHHQFLSDQAGAVIKRVASTFPYESADENTPCLKKENDVISQALQAELQEAVNVSGIEVVSVRLNDLTYAPEIAQAMLMRQQAMALIDARKTIVDGAVLIVRDGVNQLAEAGFELTSARTEELVANLLVVLCSGDHAQPMIQVQATPAGRG
jgi:regulator of protease activity HflC (stomatin/prohibitin superfamily)